MGSRGRFGKYGEIKRLDRLRRAGKRHSVPSGSDVRSFKEIPTFKEEGYPKGRLKIRPAKAADALFIGQLSGKVFDIYGPYTDIVSRWFESDLTVTLIALMDNNRAGFAMIGNLYYNRKEEYFSELLAIAIEPERQKRGIGEMLIRGIERKAIELNANRLFLHTATENLSAQKLFTKNGYRKWGIEKNFYPAGQDAVVMVKEIDREA